MSITVKWLGHASFKISNQLTVYIDPWKLQAADHDASLVLVSHSHYDHFSAEDIAKVTGPQTKVITTPDVADQLANAAVLAPGQTAQLSGISITGIAAYNPNKQFHPRTNNWLGFVVEMDSKRIYYAGDTDIVSEMESLTNIDLALLPVGGTYTMDAAEAAEAIARIQTRMALPYHWGDIVGSQDDAQKLADLTSADVTILSPGAELTL